MHATHRSTLHMLRCAHELLATDTVDPAIVQPLAEVEDAVKQLAEHARNREDHHRRMRVLTAAIREQGRALRHDLMRPVLFAARTIITRNGADGGLLRQAIRLPAHRSDYQQLLVAANGMAAAVEEHAARFLAAGLPTDFATRLRAAADSLLTALNQRSAEEQRRVAATKGVDAEARRGISVLRLLNALVQPTLRDDPVRGREWEKAIRTMRRPSLRPAAGAPTAGDAVEGQPVSAEVKAA
jgi:hypothetical protein